MKREKMSTILAILLLLSGALFVPRAFAQPPADAVQPNPLSINWAYPAHNPSETFTIYIDVVNVQGLFSFQCGFRFNPTVLDVIAVSEGAFISDGGIIPILTFPGIIDNVNGIVVAYGYSLMDVTKAKTGSGHLLKVDMRIDAGLWPPYSDSYPGGPVMMADLTDTDMDPCELILMYQDGSSEVTPIPSHIYDGSFTLYVTPQNPNAYFTWTPVPAYNDEPVNFDASSSVPGWNGWEDVPIVAYHWDWDGDGTTDETTASSTISHTFSWTPPPDVMTFTVGLIVEDADGRLSYKMLHDVQVISRPTGPVLDLQSQRWRYVDPLYWGTNFFGEGPGFPADTFRPGDWVELWAYASYNGDGVQNQLIAFQVVDNQGNNILDGAGLTDENGWACYSFRIPWPCTGPESYFGVWHAIAKWSIGMLDGKPYMKTINDTMDFEVGWGLWITWKHEDSGEGAPSRDFFKGEYVYVHLCIRNEYMTPVLATITAVIYDDLMVPLGKSVLANYMFPASGVFCHPYDTCIMMSGIHIPKWAYVGTGTAKANAFTRLPFLCGTSYSPEVVNMFIIKKTLGDPWVPDP